MEQFVDPKMLASLAEVYRLTMRLTLVCVVFVPLERLFAAHPQRIFRKQILIDLAYYVMNSLIVAMFLSVPIGLMTWSLQKSLPATILTLTTTLPVWARLCLGLVVSEVGYYWGHRLSHTIPWLWDYHVIHHSAEQMDFMVNTRAHPVDLVFTRLCSLAPQYAIGLGGLATGEGSWIPIVLALFGLFWGYFLHANLRWRFGLLERAISTPGFHHWHHTLNGPINKNYASTLPWLDWIFGTLHLPKELPDHYGVSSAVPDSLLAQLALPVSPSAPSLRRLKRTTKHETALPQLPKITVDELATEVDSWQKNDAR